MLSFVYSQKPDYIETYSTPWQTYPDSVSYDPFFGDLLCWLILAAIVGAVVYVIASAWQLALERKKGKRNVKVNQDKIGLGLWLVLMVFYISLAGVINIIVDVLTGWNFLDILAGWMSLHPSWTGLIAMAVICSAVSIATFKGLAKLNQLNQQEKENEN